MDLSSAGYYLEAELLPSSGKDGEGIIDRKCTGKKVYIHLTPRQLTVKEYFMKIIPRRLFTYRVVPATKIDLDSHHFNNGYPIITLDDGFQVWSLAQLKLPCGLQVTLHVQIRKRQRRPVHMVFVGNGSSKSPSLSD